jgi:hypothetical protein
MPTITLTPLPEAVKKLTEREVFPSGMSSRDWEDVPAQIRDRLFFSARVEEEKILAVLKSKLQIRINLVKESGATMDKSRFIAEIQQLLQEEGYKRPDGVAKGSLRDLKGSRRLSLIWDMNLAQAEGFARWKSSMTVDGLANEPCWELVRLMERKEIRKWPQIWEDAGGEFFGEPSVDYPEARGRMIAPKTSEIWTKISRFGVPWAPYDWGSGMGQAGIGIDEAEELGAVKPGDKFTPQDVPFNQGVQASAEHIDDGGKSSLRADFGDHVEFTPDKVILKSPMKGLGIAADLLKRESAIMTSGRKAIEALRSKQPAALPPDFDVDELLRETSSVGVGRKLTYHVLWTGYAETIAALLRKFLPKNVTVVTRGDHVYAFRKDLISEKEVGL